MTVEEKGDSGGGTNENTRRDVGWREPSDAQVYG